MTRILSRRSRGRQFLAGVIESPFVISRCARIGLAALLIAIVGAACGGANDPRQPPLNQAFSGRVEGTDAFIGFVIENENLHAYVCDGKGEPATVSTWFHGHERDTFLTNADGASMMIARPQGSIAGSVTFAGEAMHAFKAPPLGAQMGLLRIEQAGAGESAIVEAWIYLVDNEWRGILPPSSKNACACDAYHQRWCFWSGYWYASGAC
jgi:hypothetical protein